MYIEQIQELSVEQNCITELHHHLILKAYIALLKVVVLNKVDLLEDEELQRLERQFRNTCQHTRVFPISALMKQRTDELVS